MKPIYLERISKTISHKENVLALSIICECGSNNFDLLNYQFNGNMKMEEKEATKKIKKDFGSSFNLEMQDELYIVKRFFGFVIKKRKFSDYSPKKVFYEYLTAQCKHCGERFVLFDQERAIAGKEPGPMPENLEINKKNLTDLSILLYYDEPNSSMDFSRILIKGVQNGKKIEILDMEM